MKFDFRQCDSCRTHQCLRCTILAGKVGTYCRNCFLKLTKKKKEKVSKEAARLRFWATKGYYIFICFLIITVSAFALAFFEQILFFLAFGFVILNILYGLYLFKTLSEIHPINKEPCASESTINE